MGGVHDLKPEPVPKLVVCSVCGLDWSRHPANPLLDHCIDLLKSELAEARRPHFIQSATGNSVFTANPWTEGYH
jgi:hypothetical protein